MLFHLNTHERLNKKPLFNFKTRGMKAKAYREFDFAESMKEKKIRKRVSENTLLKIADHSLTVTITAEMIGIAVSIASYVVPYSETTAVLCNSLHNCSIASAWIVGILLGVFVFCK